MSMETYDIPDSTCWSCGHTFNASSSAGSEAPKPGDWSICIECGEIGIFDDNLLIVEPTADQLVEAPLLEIQQYLQALREAHEEYDQEYPQQEKTNGT